MPDYTRQIIIAGLLVAVGFAAGHYATKRGHSGGIREIRDTVTVYRTKYAERPVETASIQVGTIAVPRMYFFTDTMRVETETAVPVPVHDTVYLPRTQKYYCENEGRLRLWVSGYEPALDRWELDEKETTVTVRRVPRWNVSACAGYGAGKEGLTPFIGLSVGYSLIRF